MMRKVIQVLAHAYCSTILSQSNRAYSSMTRQLEAIIIEVSTVLRLRANQWQVHEVKYLPPMKVTCSGLGFYNGQASYF